MNGIGYGNSMFLATHGILARGGGVAPSLLLDTYTNAAVAYSLRKLRTAYTGSAIRVRRSVDNAEQDIGFSGNDLDTQTMLDFVGYNIWTYSEEFNNAVWVKSNLNTTGTPAYVNVETAPDSTLTGDKVIENTASDLHGFFRLSPTLVIGTTYNLSVYLKQGERTKVRILSSVAAANQRCDVDLTNGTISNNTFANTPVVTSEANGWYRFSISITATVTTTSDFFVLRLFNASNAITYTGDGTSGAYIWGFQLSQTSTVKTYQKTVATAGGNGFVTTWYDQSTNANNSTQATAANQAQIVLNGNLRLDPNNNKVSTQWTTDTYTIGTNITIAQNFLMFAVVNRAATNGVIHPLGSTSASPFIFRWGSTGNIDSQITTGTVSHATADTTIGDYVISALRDSSNVVKAWKNTNALSTGTSTGLAATITRFGTAAGTNSTGWFQELIYWNTDLESSRSAIETAINTYYSVY